MPVAFLPDGALAALLPVACHPGVARTARPAGFGVGTVSGAITRLVAGLVTRLLAGLVDRQVHRLAVRVRCALHHHRGVRRCLGGGHGAQRHKGNGGSSGHGGKDFGCHEVFLLAKAHWACTAGKSRCKKTQQREAFSMPPPGQATVPGMRSNLASSPP